MSLPYFIHGDRLAISLALPKTNNLSLYVEYEDLFTEFGFILPVDAESLNVPQALCKTISNQNFIAPTAGILRIEKGKLVYYEVHSAPGEKAREFMCKHVPLSRRMLYRSYVGAAEERIELAMRMGYTTIEDILETFSRYTMMPTNGYQFFSLKQIEEDLKKRDILPNIEMYFLKDEG